MIIPVDLKDRSYDVIVGSGCLKKASELLDLDRKVLIVTDSGVPEEYSETAASFCKDPTVYRFEQGEENKTLNTFEKILEKMLENKFTRKDCVVAVGGGVVGDIAGFAAASYMRGVDFYNVPTTVLSQVDSSIGGKTAVNLNGIKNTVGAFWQPKRVLIDTEVLKTLPKRQISAGLAEALKMAVTFDGELFKLFESKDPFFNIETIIERSLRIKADVVEKDERESGLRRVLNFGHTIGHAIESESLDGSLYHGECVAIGMIPMCSDKVRERLIPVLKKLGLPTFCRVDLDRVCEAMLHDKKSADGKITVIESEEVGTYVQKTLDGAELRKRASLIIRN